MVRGLESEEYWSVRGELTIVKLYLVHKDYIFYKEIEGRYKLNSSGTVYVYRLERDAFLRDFKYCPMYDSPLWRTLNG